MVSDGGATSQNCRDCKGQCREPEKGVPLDVAHLQSESYEFEAWRVSAAKRLEVVSSESQCDAIPERLEPDESRVGQPPSREEKSEPVILIQVVGRRPVGMVMPVAPRAMEGAGAKPRHPKKGRTPGKAKAAVTPQDLQQLMKP